MADQIAVWAVCLALSVAAPHLAERTISLDRLRPMTAAAVWAAGLALRATAAVAAVLLAVICLPHTRVVRDWLHGLPLRAGSDLGIVLLVCGGLAAAAGYAVLRRFRAADREVLSRVRLLDIEGPGGAAVVSDPQVLLAAVGVRRPRIVVSAGALAALDDDELDAALAHEHGHIRRGHRWIAAAAEVCTILARWLPGTRRAADELAFHLERDADWWAVRRLHEPAVLAAAVCKAALDAADPGGAAGAHALTGGRGGQVARRLHLLLDGVPTGSRPGNAVVRLGAVGLAALAACAFAVTATHAGADLLRCLEPHVSATSGTAPVFAPGTGAADGPAA
ncbi:M56 family metallopeptidase [Streptomycetaceae bacterium NBC_01309]